MKIRQWWLAETSKPSNGLLCCIQKLIVLQFSWFTLCAIMLPVPNNSYSTCRKSDEYFFISRRCLVNIYIVLDKQSAPSESFVCYCFASFFIRNRCLSNENPVIGWNAYSHSGPAGCCYIDTSDEPHLPQQHQKVMRMNWKRTVDGGWTTY